MGNRGNALGLIACQMLEDETVHVLSHDHEVRRILVIDAFVSNTLVPKLREKCRSVSIELVALDDIHGRRLEGPGNVLLLQRPVNLHLSPDILRDDVLTIIGEVQDLCSAILVFYGLCGNAFRNLQSMLKDAKVPVTILKDAGGQVVDDCMGVAAGGTESYLKLLRSHHGAFFLSPMWASDWRKFFVDIMVLQDPNDLEGARYIFQYMNYTKVIMMCTGLGSNDEFHEEVDRFSKAFGLAIEEYPCGTDVVDRSYAEMKRLACSGH